MKNSANTEVTIIEFFYKIMLLIFLEFLMFLIFTLFKFFKIYYYLKITSYLHSLFIMNYQSFKQQEKKHQNFTPFSNKNIITPRKKTQLLNP